jgi:hypothetical protein
MLTSRKIPILLILSLFIFTVSFNSAIGINSVIITQKNDSIYSIELEFNPSDYIFSIEQTKTGPFACIELSDEGFNYIEGIPKLPTIRRFVEIPYEAQPEIELLDAYWQHTSLDELGLPNYIIPNQESKEKIPNQEQDFIFNNDFYSKDMLVPEKIAELIETGNIRSRSYALIEISPVRYNPSNGELLLMKSCKIQIHCQNTDMQRTLEKINRYYSQTYEQFFEKAFMNYNSYEVMNENRGQEGYLMIVYDDFKDEIQPLADWKEILGYDVTITKTSEVPGGSKKEDILNYIEDAYQNWANPPVFVLLVGDTEQIPTFTGIACYTATDLEYITIDGEDFLPDIYLGRFPASTESQVQNMVEKTLYYEIGNFSSDDWIKKAAFIASEDYYWIAEQTHNYVIENYMDPQDYESDKLYVHAYGATTQDLTDAINEGRSLAIYSGHGYYTSWTDGPPYGKSDVENLMNENMYPFVCSFACLTNAYDKDECFGETWVRQEDKAALAFWGSSADTYWYEDDYLEKMMFKAWLEDGLNWIGGMTDMALLYFYENYSGGGYSRYYFEAFNINGDPSVEIWNDTPNRAPFVPDSPEGPNDALERTEQTFAAYTTDFEDHKIYYKFDWGDDTTSIWYGPYNSSEMVEATHTWNQPGIFQVRVKAKDEYEKESLWSDPQTINIIDNLAPSAPEMEGAKIAKTGQYYDLTLRSSDYEGQDVYYYIDWGDGVIEYWFGPKNSSQPVIFSHKFKDTGSITIKTKAKDTLDEVSAENILNVFVLKNRAESKPFFLQLLNRLVDSFPVLKQLLLFLQ